MFVDTWLREKRIQTMQSKERKKDALAKEKIEMMLGRYQSWVFVILCLFCCSVVSFLICVPTFLCGVLVFDSVSRSACRSAASTLSHTIFHTQLCHTQLCHPQLCHTPSFTHNFVTHNFVTHNFVTHHLSHTTLSHLSLSHTIFHTQLCHTQLCHPQLSHTPSFTHNFVTHNLVTHHLSHTTLSHTIFHLQLCHLSHTTWSPWRFAWQAWHLRHWAGSGGTLGRRLGTAGRQWRRGTLRGRRGTWWHPPSSRVAGVALGHIHLRFVWQAWHLWHWAGSGGALGRRLGAAWAPLGRRWSLVVAGNAAALCVAGVALGDIHLNLAWQAWHFTTSTFVLRGRRSTWRHPPSLCVADVALHDIDLRFALQAWHLAWDLVTSTIILCGMSGNVWQKLWPNILACLQKRLVRAMLRYVLLQAMFDLCFAASGMSYFLACLTETLGTTFWHFYRALHRCVALCYCKPCSSHVLQHQPFWHVLLLLFLACLTNTLCKIMYFWSGRFALTWKEATGAEIWDDECRMDSNCVTHIFRTQLYHTQLFTYNFINFSILHHLLCLSFLPRPATTFVSHYWKKLTCGVFRSFNFWRKTFSRQISDDIPSVAAHLKMVQRPKVGMLPILQRQHIELEQSEQKKQEIEKEREELTLGSELSQKSPVLQFEFWLAWTVSPFLRATAYLSTCIRSDL